MTEVLPTNEARAKLNQIAAAFDLDGPAAEPVVFGSHRRAQGVIVPWALWRELAPLLEDLQDTDLARRRLERAGDERATHEQFLATVAALRAEHTSA